MPVTDRDLVLASAATYGEGAATFSALDGTARVFRTLVDDVAIYAIEGTHDRLGWILDAMALPLPSQTIGLDAEHVLRALRFMAQPEAAHATVEHPDIGFVHGGIYAVLQSVWAAMLASIYKDLADGLKIALTGHSLGAGCAVQATSLLVALGIYPIRVAFFAPPRVGFKKMHALIDLVVENAAYRNGNDPVTDVPFRAVPFWLYEQRPLRRGGDKYRPPWNAHHIDNYVALVDALNPPAGAA